MKTTFSHLCAPEIKELMYLNVLKIFMNFIIIGNYVFFQTSLVKTKYVINRNQFLVIVGGYLL